MEIDAYDIKDIIKDILLEKSLTQSAFAAKVGVKQSQVSEWLSGKAKPGYDNLRKICSEIGVSSDYLLNIK